ncbi:carbohydrate porin [Acidocella sp.]|uniref:carbohydrate porin n=1 Tax=Acidocella sp. TaxID=50710 RepID=UPI0026055A38|nr:carbohydrate porin [Acidocella sp.]
MDVFKPWHGVWLCAAVGAWATPALAQTADTGLLGNWDGLKPALATRGVRVNINDSENLLADISGGAKRGATMQGVTTMSMDVNTGKAFGIPGGTFHVSALQLHGRPLSPYYLYSLQTANGDEGDNATRLWELWYDQATPNGRFDIKIGQQSIDNEFITSTYSGLFVNTMAGWPMLPSADLYGGGPAYPLSSLGVRGRFKPNGHVAIMAGVFDDDPGGGAFSADQQALDPRGGRFSLSNGALWIAELKYTTKLFNLPGTYKLGFWYDSANFPDQLYGYNHRGNYSIYGVVDQTIWQSAANDNRTLNLFGRLMGAPADENLVDFSFNGGVTLTAPLPDRNNDSAGLDFGVAHVSSRVAAADTAAGLPRQGTETLIEATYQAQATSWLVLQPDIQYIANPAGGIDNPYEPGKKLANELVMGVRGIVTF